MICTGDMGVASSTSMVPSSFSRVMEMEVIMADTSMRMMEMVPGTKRYTPLSSGL